MVHESWPLRIKQIDLSGLPPAQREAEVERLLIDEPRRPYQPRDRARHPRDLDCSGSGGACFHPDDAPHSLRLVVGGRLVAGVVGAISRLIRGETPALPPLPIQHGDYAAWQQTADYRSGFR